MSIYAFTQAELDEIRRADRAMGRQVDRSTDRRGRKPGQLASVQRRGNPVWEWRLRNNLTQEAAARVLGVCEATVRNWEHGHTRIPAWAKEMFEEEC